MQPIIRPHRDRIPAAAGSNSPLFYADMRTTFGVSFSACFNTLLTEQAALCKEGRRGELYADLTVGYDPSTEQIFAEIKDRNGELHRIFAGERVTKGRWFDIAVRSQYNPKRKRSTLTLTVRACDNGAEASQSVVYKGYALPYNVSRWVVGHGFPGGFPNSLQVRNGRMRDLAIKGTGRGRIPGQNPIFTDAFTADPACTVVGDRIYAFVGEDKAGVGGWFNMPHWVAYSSSDMVNWTNHGVVMRAADFPHANPYGAWAAQMVERDGKYYFYISPVGVIVLESESPYGPFKDALGRQLIHPDMTNYSGHGWEDIDPTVFIDDDGQAYMYWGNNALYCVKLNEDMVSFSGDIVTFEIKDREAFGSDYEEAPWIFKRNGIYYLMYAAHVPEHIYYATSSSPLGPWKYGGVVMKAFEQGSMGNHPGVAEYKGQWYFFYMNEDLPGGHEKRRAVNVIPLIFNEDDSIPELKHSKAGIAKSVGKLDPYLDSQAETIAWCEGVDVACDSMRRVYVTKIDDGDYIKVREADFAAGAKRFEAAVANAAESGAIELRIDSIDGPVIGVCPVGKAHGKQPWTQVKTKVSKVDGKHDLYLIFKGEGENLFDFDSWRFTAK